MLRYRIPNTKPAKTPTAIAFSICLVSLVGCAKPETQTASPSPVKESQKANFLKTGLSERIRIESQKVDYWSLEQRLANYKAPSVSVAFMRDWQLAWTMESGVKDVTTERVVDEKQYSKQAVFQNPHLRQY